jgi:predicted negative regulator of RcsB-dependent stress response
MDEEITIIDTNARNERIKNFFINNKKKLIITVSIILVIIIGYLSFENSKEKNKIKLANQYNLALIDLNPENKQKTIDEMVNVVKSNDATYSPLALYHLLDNNLLENNDEINILFNELIEKTNLDNEIKNLIIYKKALFNSEFVSENELLKILNPVINSESIWKSHALYLLAEFFYSKEEKQKAKEFFNQILVLPNANSTIKTESQKRLNRDLGE